MTQPLKTHHSIKDQSFWFKCVWRRGILKEVRAANAFNFLIYVFDQNDWLIQGFQENLKEFAFFLCSWSQQVPLEIVRNPDSRQSSDRGPQSGTEFYNHFEMLCVSVFEMTF